VLDRILKARALLFRGGKRCPVLCVKRGRSGAEFVSASVGVERDVGTVAEFIGAASSPIDSWIQDVSSPVGVPFDPSVCFPTQEGAFADNETNMFRPANVHSLIQSDGLALAICDRGRFNFFGRFPFRAETVRNGPQILHPVVNKRQRKILLARIAGGKEHRLDSRHLSVVRGGLDAEVNGFRETREGKEADQAENEWPKFAGNERADTYENHIYYDFYKQRGCQPCAIFIAG
jgi:hypothetical protein